MTIRLFWTSPRLQRYIILPQTSKMNPFATIFTSFMTEFLIKLNTVFRLTKGVLRNFTKFIGEYLYQSLFLIKLQASAWNFIKKEALAHVFSCEFCEISENTFFAEHLQATASEVPWFLIPPMYFTVFPLSSEFFYQCY